MSPTPVSEIINTEINDTENIIDDVDEVAEQLAANDIISQERHSEILERVDQCQNQLQQLSTQIPMLANEPANDPILGQILQAVTEIRLEVEVLKTDLKSLKDLKPTIQQTPSESTPETPEQGEEPNQAESTEEPKLAAPEPPKPRRKFRLL